MSLALVLFLPDIVEQNLGSKAGSICAHGRLGSLEHGGACNVQVHPLHVFLNELLEEGSRLTRATVRGLSLIVKVGIGRLHRFTVLLRNGHPPKRLEHGLARLDDTGREFVTVRKQTSSLRSESRLHRACERGQVNELSGLELLLHVGKSVGQN